MIVKNSINILTDNLPNYVFFVHGMASGIRYLHRWISLETNKLLSSCTSGRYEREKRHGELLATYSKGPGELDSLICSRGSKTSHISK